MPLSWAEAPINGYSKNESKNKQTNNNNKEFQNSTRDSAHFLFTSSHLACEQQTYFRS